MILITGATGNVGRELTRLLQVDDLDFRIMTRDPEKCEKLREAGFDAISGDYDNLKSLVSALKKVDKMFMLSPADPGMVERQTMLLEAAKKAKVKHLVKLSCVGAHPEAPDRFSRLHGEIEEKIVESGVNFTNLRPHYSMQNLLMFATTISYEGIFCAPMRDGRIGIVDARDVAQVAATILKEDFHGGTTYELTGPEALSFYDMSEILSAVRKRRVTYMDITSEKARVGMLRSNTPEWLIDAIMEQYEVFSAGQADQITDHIERITGHRPRGFHEFAVDYADFFAKRKMEES
ncbi:MAG: SDR family oxidoreductase [bacterium]